MKTQTIFRTGLIGTVIAALCCFTPVLVIALAALGLGALNGYLDYVLLPALGMFIVILLYGLYVRQTQSGAVS